MPRVGKPCQLQRVLNYASDILENSIGAAVCRALARYPLKGLAIHYSRNSESAKALQTELTATGPSLILTLHQADLSQSAHCERLVEEVLKAHKVVDIFISNAGGARRVTDILLYPIFSKRLIW